MKLADAVDPPEEKPIDPHVALEKLIRLDRKHTNFDYVDSSRNVHFKVQYPCIFNDAPSNDHLLRQFWRHAHNYYFRSLQESQVGRLDYFTSILNSKMPDELPFRANTTFWKGLQAIFNPTYLQKQIKSAPNDLDSQNWLCTLYLYNRLLDNQEGKSQKKLIKDLADLKQAKSTIQHVTYQKRYKESLVVQNKYLKNLLPVNQQYEDEVEQQIQRLTQQLQEKHQRTNQLLTQLNDRVRHQETQKNILYCFSNEQYQIPMKDPIKCRDQLILWDNINDIETQKQYLELCIEKLEKKQVAESLSKILKVEKFKNQSRFMVTFEQAMNVKKKIMTEKELFELNKVREYSLFKFYNTSLKSPYSFICQNFLGFRQIYLNRNKPCKYKNKNILQEVKKSVHEPLQVSRGFEKFDICHHCKLLYPDNFLIKCKYTSQKMGIPIQPAPYVDPYITQISKIETSPSERYMIRRRNCYQNYTKNDEQYVCNRKFCKYCIRQNYQDGLDKNGLCPFCQGICFCTRCARNDMIVRLKSIYLLLGGQMSKLHSEKVLEIENNETDEEETTSVRKKGRPKKVIRRTVNSNVQEGQRLGKIRMDLQPLRILCDMVKKRQKMKLRNLETQIQLFHARVKIFNRDLNLDLQKQSTIKNNISNNPKENEKLNKKLKRMI